MLLGETFAALLTAVPIAGIGPWSFRIEAVATSVGAGILLGGFVAGLLALLGIGPWGRNGITDAGYIGGCVGVVFLLVDGVLLH
jgi:hypothetical protein